MIDNQHLISSTEKHLKNNILPGMAVGAHIFGGISDLEFWSIIQTDIQEKNLRVNTANMYLNYQNNAILQHQSLQLDSIGEQLKELRDIINSKTADAERENFARDLIYNIKKMCDSLSAYEDKSFVFFEATSLLEMINQNEISTTSFTQILDKEYFDKILADLETKAKNISDEEKSDFENFILLYLYARELEKEVSDLKQEHIELINFPKKIEEVCEVIKPKLPEILEIEEELEYEIENKGTSLSIFSKLITKYIKSPSELHELFEKFFEEKKNYEKEMLYYSYSESLKSFYVNSLKRYENSLNIKKNKNDEILKKWNFSIHAVNKYLENHSDFEKYYPKISQKEISETNIVIDFHEAKNSYYEEFLRKTKNLEESLNAYYLKENELLERRRTRRKTKIRKFGSNGGNIGCVVFIILIIGIFLMIKKFIF